MFHAQRKLHVYEARSESQVRCSVDERTKSTMVIPTIKPFDLCSGLHVDFYMYNVEIQGCPITINTVPAPLHPHQ